MIIKILSGTCEAEVMFTGENQDVVWVVFALGSEDDFRVVEVHF